LPAYLSAIKPSGASAMAPEFLNNKGNQSPFVYKFVCSDEGLLTAPWSFPYPSLLSSKSEELTKRC